MSFLSSSPKPSPKTQILETTLLCYLIAVCLVIMMWRSVEVCNMCYLLTWPHAAAWLIMLYTCSFMAYNIWQHIQKLLHQKELEGQLLEAKLSQCQLMVEKEQEKSAAEKKMVCSSCALCLNIKYQWYHISVCIWLCCFLTHKLSKSWLAHNEQYSTS